MIKVTVQKNLIGLEDLLIGVGTVEQARGPSDADPVTITKINGANFPYDATYTMAEKFDALQAQIDNLPIVVDEGGNLLTGLINTSDQQLDLAGRLWRKEIDADTAGIYYGDQLILEYDPVDGNIYIPGGTDYVAADAVVTAAYEAADDALAALIAALDSATENVQGLDVGTSANNLVQLDGDGKLPAVDGSALTGISSVPVGMIMYGAFQTAPTGWAKANGAAISRTTYAALFAAIGTTFGAGDTTTTFNLPDLRGEFIRGFDDSRGIDSGRVFGSAQADAFKSHTHGVGQNAGIGTGNNSNAYSAADTSNNILSTAAGGTETRPRNIALMPFIKVT